MWLKLLFYLRLFAPFAALIRMIETILKDMVVFFVLFAIAVIGFGNAFYILSYNLADTRFENAGENEIGHNILEAIIFSYKNSLGDFQTDGFEGFPSSPLVWIIFIFETVIIQIVLLNLLIAIMADTFNKVTEKKEESKLREMCQLISEYEYVIDR